MPRSGDGLHPRRTCDDCVEDPYLKHVIQSAASAGRCDYCGRSATTPIAAEASVVVEVVYDTVLAYYCEPAAGGVPYDGGYIIDPIDIREVLGNLASMGTLISLTQLLMPKPTVTASCPLPTVIGLAVTPTKCCRLHGDRSSTL